MGYYNPLYENTVIYCNNCYNKLRVPTDKGKISVNCPVCRKQFIYNPKSIIHTLKQIAYSIIYGFPKNRKKQAIIAVVILILIAALMFMIFGRKDNDNIKIRPGEMVYENYLELRPLKPNAVTSQTIPKFEI